jgi:hypothetical protein
MTVLLVVYLMSPPRSIVSRERGTLELERDAPLHMWVMLRSYDSAGECEAGAKAIEHAMRSGAGDWRGVSQAELKFSLTGMALHRCVAEDDPRLR